MTDLRVVVDTIPILPSSGGIKIYLLNLLRRLNELDCRLHLVCSRSNRNLFSHLPVDRTTVLPVSTAKPPVRIVAQQVGVPLAALRSGGDVLFTPVDVAPLLSPIPMVTAIHSSHINVELGVTRGLHALYLQSFMRATVHRSARIIAISEYTRDTAVQLLRADPASITVVPHGGGVVQSAVEAGWEPPPYEERTGGIFFIGSLFPHKNVDVLIRAYALLAREGPDSEVPPLTIAGKNVDGQQDEMNALARSEGVGDRVRFLGRVSDETLLQLYGSSKMLVFPSSVEGFGLPPLEAMQAGLPVVASDRTSVPEVVGEAALMVDPTDAPALREAMGRILNNADLRRSLVEKGRARADQFSWTRTARRTMDVLRRAARA